MKHLKENQIIACALGLGEAGGREHLAACAACASQTARLQRLLEAAAPAAAPAAPPGLAARIWQALPPPQAAPPRRRAAAPALRAGLAAAAALALGLWLARSHPRGLLPPAAAPAAGGRQRLYLAAAAHLDRTQALLVELEHAPAGPGGVVNLAPERAAARALLAANRRYQQRFTSGPPQATGMAAATLATLEPVLVEIEHAPPRASRQEWRTMEGSIVRNAILFKVRVLQQTLRARAQAPKEVGSL